ncbi:valine--tRNA ligase [Candidatus Beckwithbacteria bacterium CG10_big_fil_rev_8_21_14_0_10_34_10]|uniref:Valine--tRNA ligase n=1 Tax=Candidatus Beckwithbacteria bacterium CG10_big_fil_rev_8_21_14_0_10_34_10 TaxID=1974495 RepID=A0A2H0W896_9BACT|nr:MAG: valine--tRNA ligase [Candidatus Beckwithbacteria bacterium CG10_big_fil_rev_8_21_14_0_10_34_10]
MEKRYQPQKLENKISKLWVSKKTFSYKRDKNKKPFSIIMPPPNANAPLHIGHAMFIALEDIMTRFNRMKGQVCLWLPGADHAGILTQVVFEKKLASKGKTRFDLGRSEFYRQCYSFTQKNKKLMYDQLKKIGGSANFAKEKFTLDPKISQEVLKSFMALYKDKLAYRGDRLVNWCPRCMTALSDLEVEHLEVKTKLWFIKYPLKTHSQITGETRFLVVATTRPETLLGDTALAVNRKDQRYQMFINQKAILPLVNRLIPIIADKAVDMEFGTGVIKVTPAHDPTDWEMGQRHKLKKISVLGFNNRMTKKAGKEYEGLKKNEARRRIVELLNRQNLLIKVRNYNHSVGHCERCKTIVEPLISKQWFLKTNKRIKLKSKSLEQKLGRKQVSLKEMGILAVKKKHLKILPHRFKINYLNWMRNLHDWCISRQLWWGQQMPIYYCGSKGLSPLQKQMNPKLAKVEPGCGTVIVSLTKPKACPKCRKRKSIIQDPDVFDTWFSSAQWPYTSLGFPNSHDYKYFYPTSVMETGYEILNIWVARMIMMGLYRTKKVPFKTVYLHGLVKDAFGEKMSKSKGNVINPLEVIAKHGADALRMALVVGATPGNDISIGEEKIKGYRNFTNKVWNIGRFINLNLKSTKKNIPLFSKNLKGLTKEDKLIIKKLEQLIKETTLNLETYKFSLAGEAIYHFLWHELADKYLEYSKERLNKKDVVVLAVLSHLYLNSLKLLHPFMPFVTEAVWQEMPEIKEKVLASSSWPK